jgi:endonuclease G, mitochondrial
VRLAAVLLALLLAGCHRTQPDAAPVPESVHVALGAPVAAGPTDDYIIARPQYVVAYSPSHRGPSWAAWDLNRTYFGGAARHRGHFITDDSLPAGFYRVTHAYYTGSGYDRGHMVRSEDRTRSDADNASTFLLSNVLPQRHDLNDGPWLRLEDACRTLAQYDGRELFIAAGPIYSAQPATIGHGVAVPVAFWKVVVVLAPGQGAEDVTPETRVVAVVMPNVDGIADAPWARYRVSVADVERRSGYRLLGRVPEAVRAALEAKVDGAR